MQSTPEVPMGHTSLAQKTKLCGNPLTTHTTVPEGLHGVHFLEKTQLDKKSHAPGAPFTTLSVFIFFVRV